VVHCRPLSSAALIYHRGHHPDDDDDDDDDDGGGGSGGDIDEASRISPRDSPLARVTNRSGINGRKLTGIALIP